MKYVLCVAIWSDLVCLILKEKPDWQKNKFNFPGGKIEEGESSQYACIREWKEETGCSTKPDNWIFKGMLWGNTKSSFQVDVWLTNDVEPDATRTATPEPISWHKLRELPSNCLDNIQAILDGCEHESFEIEY